MKTCVKCGTKFDGRRCTACHKVWRAKRYASMREKAKADALRWRKENPKRVLENAARYRERNRGRVRAHQRRYASANREVILGKSAARYAADPAAHRVYTKRWALLNGAKIRSYKANRRTRERTGKVSPGLVGELLMLQRGRCAACSSRLGTDYHMDHVMPLCLGGQNVDGNIQLLCPGCNRRKQGKDPLTFMRSRGYLL